LFLSKSSEDANNLKVTSTIHRHEIVLKTARAYSAGNAFDGNVSKEWAEYYICF